MTHPSSRRGLARNTSNYGDRDFALYLRRSFAKSMGYSQAMLDRPVELFQEIELFQLVEQFFDRAVYFAAVGKG